MLITKINNVMLKWYYILWSDAINWTRSSINYIGVWKMHTLGFISFFMATNVMFICMLLKIDINTDFITLSHSNIFDRFLGFIVIFYLPPLIINYLFIFSRNQWEHIRKNYKHYNGKLYKMYYVVSLLLPFSIVMLLYLAYTYCGLEL